VLLPGHIKILKMRGESSGFVGHRRFLRRDVCGKKTSISCECMASVDYRVTLGNALTGPPQAPADFPREREAMVRTFSRGMRQVCDSAALDA